MAEIPHSPWNTNEMVQKPNVELGVLAKECGVSEAEMKETMKQLGCAKPEREHVQRQRPGKPPISKSVLTCTAEDAEKLRRHFRVFSEAPFEAGVGDESKEGEILKDYVALGRLRIKLGLTKREMDIFLHEMIVRGVGGGGVQTPFGMLPQASGDRDIIDGQGVTYGSPMIAERMTDFAAKIFRERDSGRYFDTWGAIRELGIVADEEHSAEDRLQQEVDSFIGKYPWLASEIVEKSFTLGGQVATYYSRDFINFIRKMREVGNDLVSAVDQVPPAYVIESDVANGLQLFPSKLEILTKKALTGQTLLDKPIVGLFQPGSQRKRVALYYSPALVGKIEKIKADEDALRAEQADVDVEDWVSVDTGQEIPEGYLAQRDCISMLEVTNYRFDRLVEEAQQHHPEFVRPIVPVTRRNRSLRPRIFYSQELIRAVSELKKSKDESVGVAEATQEAEEQRLLAEGYVSRATSAIDLGISTRKLASLVNTCIGLQPELQLHETVFIKPGRSRDFSVFYSPELVRVVREKKRVDEESRRLKAEEEQRVLEETIALKESLATVLSNIDSDQPEAIHFRRMMALFGGARTLDILYRLHPEFRKLSDEYMKKEVATHLSDFMISRSENVIEDLEMALPFLDEKVFQDTLRMVLKEYCVRNYTQKKRASKDKTDRDILEGYVASLKSKAISLGGSALNKIVEDVDIYVTSLLEDFQKPSTIVDGVGTGREFPDLNQIVNIKAVADQRRVLIGDEMGMGKSASAILSKEYLGLGTTIVVVPNNAVDLWQEYLSDHVAPDGKQIGYFKPGMAPKVLEVQVPEDVDKAMGGEYDYVVVSHTRINDACARKLSQIPYEMVVIDEAHKFKNVTEGMRANALLDMLEDCETRDTYTVLLSGTPIPNKIRDMAITLKLLYPERFGRVESSIIVSDIIRGDLIGLRELLLNRTQMKKLSESVEMPNKEEMLKYVELSVEERELYQVILQDEQLSAMEKISALRLFCLNPGKVYQDREVKGSKIAQTEQEIASFFETKDKLVMFMNGYVKGVIREGNSVLAQMSIPADVTVRIIDGEVSREERRQIEQQLREKSSGKMLLVVNGSAVDVAVDFSAAEGVYFYNEPWTKFDKMQQSARVYRPGLKQDIKVDTSITKDSIEQGMHHYIEMKYRAVQKLLEGIPLSEIEKALISLDEKASETTTIERDPVLAEEWLQTPIGRLRNYSRLTKEVGEVEFRSSFLEEHGEEYALAYAELETHSEQANTGRFVAALIEEYRLEKGLTQDMMIADLASGPEMLRKRMRKEVSTNVHSLDINPEHFDEPSDKKIVGGFVSLPFSESSVDYVNLSHALHYSSFRPERGDYERLIVLSEIARVLKVGGRATISLAHTQRFRSIDSLRELADEMGLEVVDSATGMVTSGDQYRSQCVTFEKIEEIDLPSTIEELKTGGRYLLYGLRLDMNVRTKKLRGSQQIVGSFALNERIIGALLNEDDTKLLAEQQSIQDEGRRLIQEYDGEINAIPREEIIRNGYLRYTSGKKSRLVKKGMHSQSFIYIN